MRFNGNISVLKSPVFTTMTLKNLFSMVLDEIYVPCNMDLEILYAGKRLSPDNLTLADHGFCPEPVLDVIPALQGGTPSFLFVQDTKGRKCRLYFEGDQLYKAESIQHLSSLISNALLSDMNAAQSLEWDPNCSVTLTEREEDGVLRRIPGDIAWTFANYLADCRSKQKLPVSCPLNIEIARARHGDSNDAEIGARLHEQKVQYRWQKISKYHPFSTWKLHPFATLLTIVWMSSILLSQYQCRPLLQSLGFVLYGCRICKAEKQN